MFCPQCRDEYREGFTRCHDCAVDLVDALPPEAAPAAAPTAAPAAAAPATAEGRAVRLAEVALVYFIGFGSSVVSSLHHVARRYAEPSDPNWNLQLWQNLTTIASRLPPLCVLAFVLSRRGRTLRDLGLTFRWLDIPQAIALMLVAWPNLLGLTIRILLGLHVPVRAAAAYGFGGMHFEMLAPAALVAVLFSAAAEELIVRAYLMSEILDLTGSALLAIGVSVFLQDLYHLYQGVFAFFEHIWGFLFFALFYWKTRRATPVVLAHYFTNLWMGLH